MVPPLNPRGRDKAQNTRTPPNPELAHKVAQQAGWTVLQVNFVA